MADAECRGEDINVFFVEKGARPYTAMMLCDRCRVRDQCLEYAVNNGIREGIWGGKSTKERRAGIPIGERYLSPAQRKRIVGLHRVGWSDGEIAREIDCSIRTVLRTRQAAANQ